MNILLFGATGMVGQGILRECLLDQEIEKVLAIGRKASGHQHEKLQELVHKNLFDYQGLEKDLSGFDACFFCLGVTSAGMSEDDYRSVTYDLTLAAAKALLKLNPGMTFIYASGAGADSTESSRSMWARVRGQTENALLRLPFKSVYVFRPAVIQPLHGITSRTRSYRILYVLLKPVFPLLRGMLPKYVTTTVQIGQAMLAVVKHGYSKPVLESADINAV
jgi:uncharacterized protein YbjT (DUF2867 family)